MLRFLPARVGRQVEMTSGCIIGSKCEVSSCEVLPENTIIYGSECHRRVAADKPPVSMTNFAEPVNATFFKIISCGIHLISSNINFVWNSLTKFFRNEFMWNFFKWKTAPSLLTQIENKYKCQNFSLILYIQVQIFLYTCTVYIPL